MLNNKIKVLLAFISAFVSVYAVESIPVNLMTQLDQNSIKNISKLDCDGNMSIVLLQSPVSAIYVTKGNKNDIALSLSGSTLKITQKNRFKKVQLAVHLNELDFIKANGNFTLKCPKSFKSDNIHFQLNGLNSVDFSSMNVANISGSSSGLSIISFNGNAQKINFDFHGFGMLDRDKMMCSDIKVKNHGLGLLTSFSQFLELFKV